MKSNEVYDYVRKWLIDKKIQKYFKHKKEEKKVYIKITEEELYELCIKLVNLMESSTR